MTLASLPLAAVAGGSLIFIIVIIVFFFVIVLGYYTRKGSGIDHHPSDGLDGAPGSEGPNVMSKGRGPDDKHGGGDDAISTHGTH